MTMTPVENLYYAIGELAYAVARADGQVQEAERRKFHDIVTGELGKKDASIDISEIIFKLMDKRSSSDSETTYTWAMNEIVTNSHYLSPSLKQKFIKVMERIAAAYPPVTPDEERIINRFKTDIQPLEGDPIYYNQR
jgi:uncharacterized tellurite resistance protein B-like protein